MKAHVFFVSYVRDFSWFTYSIRTLEKFGSGFSGVTCCVPHQDLSVFQQFCDAHKIRLRGYIEVPSKSFICHMLEKCNADLWVPRDTDLIVHLDSDSIFVEKFSLDTYLHKGLPIMMREHFGDFKHYPSRQLWKRNVDYALRMDAQWETMCRHPCIYWINSYRHMRDRVEAIHGIPFSQFVLFQKDSFPQSWAEHPTMGALALECNWSRYQVVDSIITPGKYWADPKWEALGLPSSDKINACPPPLHPDGRGNGVVGEYWAEQGWKSICLWHNADGTIENRPYPPNPMRYYWSHHGTEKFRAELDALVA